MRPLLEKESLNKIANVPVVRCRARREIRTHAGNVQPSALGTIISRSTTLAVTFCRCIGEMVFVLTYFRMRWR